MGIGLTTILTQRSVSLSLPDGDARYPCNARFETSFLSHWCSPSKLQSPSGSRRPPLSSLRPPHNHPKTNRRRKRKRLPRTSRIPSLKRPAKQKKKRPPAQKAKSLPKTTSQG